MSIGPRSLKKRARNDLDDYLDEVDSRLFCVTRADRQCLHRDLKAHVRELTTDERSADRFGGRYQITMEQLREEIGEPDEIATNYISSVKRKVPSTGLNVFIAIMTGVFIATIVIGIDRIEIGQFAEVSNGEWLSVSGYGLVIGGALAIGILVLIVMRFDRYHLLIVLLSIIFIPLAITSSNFFSSLISSRYLLTVEQSIFCLFSALFLIDFVIIGVIGLYVYLKHYQVMNSKESLSI